MSLDLYRDCTFVGPALPEPFVRFELEAELLKAGLLPRITGAEARQFQDLWVVYRRKLRELVRGGSIRVRNQVIEGVVQHLGYGHLENAVDVQTREGREDGGDLLVSADGNARIRVWTTEFDEDLEAPSQRGSAYRYSRVRIAQRVLLASGERLGLLTNGTELRILISDPARPDSQIIISIDPSWKDKRSFEAPDSYRLLLALASPKGVLAVPDLVEKARLQQSRVTKELRRQAREAVEAFLQEVLDHPTNQVKLGELNQRPHLARELWREALIVVYRLLFILKLESTDDPARSFSFASTSLWRNTFSPSVALPRYVRSLLDQNAPTGSLLEHAVRGLFRMFVEGLDCTELRVRPLGGTLFGEKVTPLLSDLVWGERGVALLLDRLLWTSPKRGIGRERVHYGSLDVEDLGRVYEALLELEPGVATEPMCRLRRAKLEVVVPMAQGERYRPAEATPADDSDPEDDLEDSAEEIEEEPEAPARGRATKVEWIEEILPGRFYLRVGLGRKSTGSYYTPHSFVRFLVQETLGPLVEERSPKDDPRPAEILKLKVLDPAMGSGHFLVEACRFLAIRLYEAARLCDEHRDQYEKTANAAQNEEIKAKSEAHAADYRERLQAFLPPDAELLAYLPSRSPEASESGLSQKRAEAICRRLAAIHCLYGVDKNPLAVELAKISLWIESHSEGLPLTFLDHRLVLGDSITGPFFHQLLTYPETKRPVEDLYTQRLPEKLTEALDEAIKLIRDIESTLGATIGDVEVKQTTRRKLQLALAPFKVVAAAWSGGVTLGTDGCDDAAYKWLLSFVANAGHLPGDLSGQERLLDMIACGLGRETVPADPDAITALLEEDLVPAFPYDLSFPEVFFRTAEVSARTGFDAVLGNPPWDTITIKRKEWFASFEFEVLNASTKRERDLIEQRVLADPARAIAFRDYVEAFEGRKRINDALYRFQKVQVQGDLAGRFLDEFRLFMERNAQLLAPHGKTGVVVPSAFHANEGATGVRQLYLEKLSLEFCFSFENKRKLFEIHSSFKFALVCAQAGSHTSEVNCAFYLHDDEWLFQEQRERPPLNYPLEFIRYTGREYLSLLELRRQQDVDVALLCYKQGLSFKQFCLNNNITFRSSDLNVTLDSWRLRLAPSTELDLRDPEQARRLLSEAMFLMHEGKTFHQFDDHWGAPPRYVVPFDLLRDKPHWYELSRYYRTAYRAIASSTNERTGIFALIPPPAVSSYKAASDFTPSKHPNSTSLFLVGTANTLTFDFLLRQMVGSDVLLFILERVPLIDAPERIKSFIVHSSLRLSANHVGYEHLWKEQLGDAWREQEAEYSWPVLSDSLARWKVQTAIDAVVADAYGLSRQEYKYVLSAFSHRSHPGAPALCLNAFDELRAVGPDSFIRAHDPYWEIPVNENLPQPVIDIPLPPSEVEAQGTLTLTGGELPEPARRADSRSRSSSNNGIDPAEYERVKQILFERGQVTSADLQTAFGFDATHSRVLLKQLVDDGIAVAVGHARATRYVARPEAAHGHTAE